MQRIILALLKDYKNLAECWFEKMSLKIYGHKNPRKDQYAYPLTPKGLREKSLLTQSFTERKREEFDLLKVEIRALEEEAGLAAEARLAASGGKQ